MPESETEILAELVRAKRTCLSHLREMTQRQLALIEQNDMGTLLDLLGLKQRTIIQLQRIERALDPYRNQDPERRNWASAEARLSCGEQIRQCEKLLGEIISQEKRGEEELVRRRDETAHRLREIHSAGQARGAYASIPQATVSQLDLLSDIK
jgi:hypothetical protein